MKLQSLFLIALGTGLLVSCGSESKPPTSFPKTNAKIESGEVISSGQLKGMFINAGTDSPVVLIVPGSGPTDLDGNNPIGVNANTYKKLAEGLEAKGISTVRVDKRGMFSSQPAGDPNAVTVDIYAEDYKNWAKTVRAKTSQPCVYMLGHSEGGIMVTTASIDNPNVCGLILVSAPGRSFGDILTEQLKANPANKPILKQALGAIEALENGEVVDENQLHRALRPLFNTRVQGFLMSVMKLDPTQLAKAADTKTLIIQGNNDIQVSVADANLLAEATGGHLVIIEGVNHVLKDAPKSRMGNVKTYSNPDLPISPAVIEAINIFINQ